MVLLIMVSVGVLLHLSITKAFLNDDFTLIK